MARFLVCVACGVFVMAVLVGLCGHRAEACPSVNEADIAGRDVSTEQNGAFSFLLDATWRLKSDPSWVTVQLAQAGQFNVSNVEYYPSYLQYQDCDDSYTFSCEGNLTNTAYDGNVNTQFDAGLAPNHAGDLEATFIPKP